MELLTDSVMAPQGAAMSIYGVPDYVNESCHCECLHACPLACVLAHMRSFDWSSGELIAIAVTAVVKFH